MVRVGAGIATTCAHWFVCDKIILTSDHLLSEAARTAVHHNVRRFVVLLCAHVEIRGVEFPRSDRDMTRLETIREWKRPLPAPSPRARVPSGGGRSKYLR